MNINEFVSERKKDWEKLETLADRIGPGARSRLTGSELWELGTLYTAAVSDLSVMRSSASAQGVDPDVLEYLNSLVIRVHGIIYRKPPFRWSAVRWFVVEGFPGTFRDNSAYVGVSAALFLLFGLLGFIMSLNDPGFIELLVPEDLIAKVEKGQVWFTDLYTVAPLASSWLMTHNISVTFLMVASGITFGVGTMYLLAVNGLLLGAVGSLCFMHGLSVDFWSFVLPHGTLELSAVCIAGGAGLILAHALIDPGPHQRAEFLAVRGRPAGILAVGCVPLLVIAGVVEAFFSPAPLPWWIKFVFAAVTFCCLTTYLYSAGRGTKSSEGVGGLHPANEQKSFTYGARRGPSHYVRSLPWKTGAITRD